MTHHEDSWKVLPLAAAGGLDPGEDRVLRTHVSECTRCAEELETLQELVGSVKSLPTPLPPAGLVDRVRRQVELELAGRADQRLNDVLLVFLLLFSWTMTFTSFLVVRFLTGEPLALWDSLSSTGLRWSFVYLAVSWITGAAVVVLFGLNYRRANRLPQLSMLRRWT